MGTFREIDSVVVVIIEWALADCLFPLTFIFFFFFLSFFLLVKNNQPRRSSCCVFPPHHHHRHHFLCVCVCPESKYKNNGVDRDGVLMMNLRLFGGAITVSLAISHGNPAEDCRFDLLLLLPWLALLFSYMFVDVQETCRRRLRRQWPSAHYIRHVHTRHATSSTHSCGWIALFPLISRSLFCFFSFCAALLFIDRGTNTRENREKRPWFSPFFCLFFI